MRSIAAAIGRIEEWILGYAGDRAFSSTHLRDIVLVRFLLLIVPIVVVYAIANVFEHDIILVCGNFAIAVDLFAGLAFLKSGRREAATNLIIFGGTVIEIGSLVLQVLNGTTMADSRMMLVRIILSFAIILMGLYAERQYQIVLSLAVAVGFTLFWSAYTGQLALGFPGIPMDFLVLYAFGFAIAKITRHFVLTLERMSEARGILNAQLEQLNRSTQDSYAATVERFAEFSHDMRSPLTGMRNIPALLLETELTVKQEHYVRLMDQANRALSEMVQNYLDSVTTSAKPEQQFHRMLISDFLDRIVAPYIDVAARKGIDLICSPGDETLYANLPTADMSRALRNVMDNALRYTDSGSITISADLQSAGRERDRISIRVSDTGTGMSERRLKQVNRWVSQPDPAMKDSHGIGLNSVRRILENYDGRLDVSSEAGRGTTVTISFLIPQSRGTD